MKNTLTRLLRDTRGQDLVEYALLGAGISLVAAVVLSNTGATLQLEYSAINDQVHITGNAAAYSTGGTSTGTGSGTGTGTGAGTGTGTGDTGGGSTGGTGNGNGNGNGNGGGNGNG